MAKKIFHSSPSENARQNPSLWLSIEWLQAHVLNL